MKVFISFSKDDDDTSPYHVPTVCTKDNVETLHDMAYFLEHAVRAAGFQHFGGVAFYSNQDQSDIANSSDLMAVHFGNTN